MADYIPGCRWRRCGSCAWRNGEWGKKCPVLTVPQTREIFTHLLRNPAPTASRIAAMVTTVLVRNEGSRIYSWHAKTGRLPPRRSPPLG